jgi:hypothetical protein
MSRRRHPLLELLSDELTLFLVAVIEGLCYGLLAVVSDVDDGGFALNVDNELRGSAVL